MCAGPDKPLGWYSDGHTYDLEISGDELHTYDSEDISAIPTEDPGNPLFLSADDHFLVAMQRVRPQLPTLMVSVASAVIQCSLMIFLSRRGVVSTLLSSWLQD
jgi:hypothetical protein